jgi:hypothetical protein
VTTYAVDGSTRFLVSVWAAGVGHRAAAVCELPDAVPQPVAAELSEALTRLSQQLWDTYASPQTPATDPDADDLTASERGEGFNGVLQALAKPYLPDGQGLLMVSYDPLLEAAHAVGRALHAVGEGRATRAVNDEVGVEVDAVLRAHRGDLTGRAVQAVALDRFDVSPVQIAAADQLLRVDPMGSEALWTSVDAAAACVAAAHWLAGAAQVAAEVADVEPAAVFGYADDIEAVSIDVPATVVTAILDEQVSPREVVIALLAEAAAVREGRVPDPVAMLQRVDDVRAQIARLPLEQREHVVDGMLERLTLLNPLRPARDLLEHLLDGIRACLIVNREAAADTRILPAGGLNSEDGDQFDDEAADAACALVDEEFMAAVRQRAGRDSERLGR